MPLQQTEPVVIPFAQGVRFSAMIDGSLPSNANVPSSQVIFQSEGASRITLLRSLHQLVVQHDVVVLRSSPGSWNQIRKALHHLLQRSVAHPDSPPEYVYFYYLFHSLSFALKRS